MSWTCAQLVPSHSHVSEAVPEPTSPPKRTDPSAAAVERHRVVPPRVRPDVLDLRPRLPVPFPRVALGARARRLAPEKHQARTRRVVGKSVRRPCARARVRDPRPVAPVPLPRVAVQPAARRRPAEQNDDRAICVERELP